MIKSSLTLVRELFYLTLLFGFEEAFGRERSP